MTGISVRGLSKGFGGKRVLDNVDLEVRDGEFLCLLGPSGCGKSTLLRSIAGLETPDVGVIRLGSDTAYSSEGRVNLPPEKRHLGMVFQSFALWPHKTVYENVAYPLRRQRVANGEVSRRVAEVLSMVGLSDFVAAYPQTLSGGQQQRVALARAIVARPKLLLLDEPLSSLDANLRARMRREVREIQQLLGATALYVTHDKEDAGGLADRVAVLQDGKIIQEGSPRDVFVRPKTSFVAEFVGFDNFIPATVREVSGDSCAVSLAGDSNVLAATTLTPVTPGSRVTLAVRSRLVRVIADDGQHRPDNAFRGVVRSKAHLGDDVEIVVSGGPTEMIARVRPGYANDIAVGSSVFAVPPPGASVVVTGTPHQRREASQPRLIGPIGVPAN